jgi:hypothetical protein
VPGASDSEKRLTPAEPAQVVWSDGATGGSADEVSFDADVDESEEDMRIYERQIGSFQQYARHQVLMAIQGLHNPADVAVVRAAVVEELTDMVRSAGQDPEDLKDVLAAAAAE